MKDLDDLAFPIHGGVHENQCNGMTLRDYFAAHIIPALIVHPSSDPKRWVADAYSFADDMLKERLKP